MPDKIKLMRKNKKAVLIVCIAFLAVFFVALDIPHGVRGIILGSPDLPKHFGRGDALDIAFFDVGQGDSALIGCKEHYVLVDAGEADMGFAVLRYLDALRVKKLDAIIISHPHSDHIGGAQTVVENIKTQMLILRESDAEDDTSHELLKTAERRGMDTLSPDAGDKFMFGDIKITFLYPDEDAKFENLNNASLVLLAENANTRALFTGDMERESEFGLLELGVDISADILKAAHHGSDTSSTEEFLRAASPEYVVISCAEGNEFGHPHKEVLERLKSLGAEVYITGFDGSVYFSFEEDGTIMKKAG